MCSFANGATMIGDPSTVTQFRRFCLSFDFAWGNFVT